MSIKNKDVTVSVGEVLRSSSMLEQMLSARMPAVVAYKVTMIKNKVAPMLDAYEEARKSAVAEFVKTDEKGNPLTDEKNEYTFEDGNKERFMEQINSVLQQESEIKIPLLSFDELGEIKQQVGGKDWEPTPMELESILYMIDLE